jgi:hypothetical protein
VIKLCHPTVLGVARANLLYGDILDFTMFTLTARTAAPAAAALVAGATYTSTRVTAKADSTTDKLDTIITVSNMR